MRKSVYISEILLYALVILFMIALPSGVSFLVASQEARSYKKFCNTEVTTWDALWLDLRIDECK